jgi:hypothetical protein
MDFVPSGTAQRFRLLLDSTGGGGYGRPDSAGVSPTSTRKNKKPLSFSKSRKKKKGLQTEVLQDWGFDKKLKKLLKNYLTTLL